jgi:cyclopropane fatty-acyl-phospholipid synthase-like methyltransferase
MSVDQRQFAPATARNREFILPILQRVLPAKGNVLEIGSGTGEHAVFFASKLPNLTWQPSEMNADALPSIQAWVEYSAVPNISSPIVLDVNAAQWPILHFGALVCINVIHYSPWSSTQALFAGASILLPADGVIYCYGAYKRGGRHTAPSNEAFDMWLKDRDPHFGVRDLEAVEEIAVAQGFRLDEVIAMPSNNFSLIFRRA